MAFSSKNILLSLLGISVILIFFKFFTLISFPAAHILDDGEMQKIYPSQTFSQKFIADRDNLTTVQFLLKPPGIKDGDTVSVKLADATCATAMREGALEIPFLNSDNLYLFTFPQIEDSEGKTYCLLLSFQTKNNPNKYLRFFTVEAKNQSLLLTNFATNEPVNGQALSLRAVYRNDHWWQDLVELNQRISQYKPWFLKDIFIGGIAISFIILSIMLAVILITSESRDAKEK